MANLYVENGCQNGACMKPCDILQYMNYFQNELMYRDAMLLNSPMYKYPSAPASTTLSTLWLAVSWSQSQRHNTS